MRPHFSTSTWYYWYKIQYRWVTVKHSPMVTYPQFIKQTLTADTSIPLSKLNAYGVCLTSYRKRRRNKTLVYSSLNCVSRNIY